ncbi:hypothetical protein SOASR032_08670 [Pragia fontium]|uniref:Tail fiber protein n=1 Tax=Pragia fontium TaxID=82985 RepID=A0ABQ5LFA4_9GAMM|nr:H-type lectin domain-containing protein [Pragia fontium]GKX62298.1 hypothetical protein SOASR032_08670 [Pragia fontium]
MTIYQRPDEKILAESSKQDEVKPFPDISRGWGVAFDKTGGIPPMEWFNALGQRTDEAIRYLLQRGIAEWSKTEDYPAGALVSYNKDVWLAERNSKGIEPKANTVWKETALTIEQIKKLIPVNSVNGKTGNIVLNAGDVGALDKSGGSVSSLVDSATNIGRTGSVPIKVISTDQDIYNLPLGYRGMCDLVNYKSAGLTRWMYIHKIVNRDSGVKGTIAIVYNYQNGTAFIGCSDGSDNPVIKWREVITSDGGILTGQLVSTNVNPVRFKAQDRSMIFRWLGNVFTLLFTDKGDPNGSWNNLRPLEISPDNGIVKLGHGVSITGSAIKNGKNLLAEGDYGLGYSTILGTNSVDDTTRGSSFLFSQKITSGVIPFSYGHIFHSRVKDSFAQIGIDILSKSLKFRGIVFDKANSSYTKNWGWTEVITTENIDKHTPYSFQAGFGKTGVKINFPKPFAVGTVPVVTITNTGASSGNTFIESVDHTGFTAIYRYSGKADIADINWLACAKT